MGVEVKVQSVDDDSGVSRLSVANKKGNVETPTRFVNRNDLNAKSTIGADVPLTTGPQPFLCEHELTPVNIHGILNTNGYLAHVKLELEETLRHVDRTAFTVVYPKLTRAALAELPPSGGARVRVSKFLLDVMSEVPADIYAVQAEMLGPEEYEYLAKQGSPIVPVVDIHNLDGVAAGIEVALKSGPGVVPLLGFTYATYPRANLAYEKILEARTRLHEAGVGIIVLGAPHVLGEYARDGKDLSGAHYSSFLVGDVVGQRYYSGGGPPVLSARIFEKEALEAPYVSKSHDFKEHEGEDGPFATDPKLRELFWRTMRAENTDEDWRKHRVPALSRVHEVLTSGQEFGSMRRFISSGELDEYRQTKTRLAALLHRERPLD